MVRTLAGIVAGIAAAIAIMMSVEAIGHRLTPAPGIILTGSSEPGISLISLLFPVFGWFLGALVGGWLAVRLSKLAWTAWAVAAAVVVGTLIGDLMMPYPLWMIAAGVVVPLLAAWLAQLFGRTSEVR